jgi:phosphatidylglycerophosphate synthase
VSDRQPVSDAEAVPPPLTLEVVRDRGQGDRHLVADPTYARILMRRISPYLTLLIARHTRLSADAITSLSILAGLGAAIAIVVPSAAFYLLAMLLLQIAYLLDVVDGEVARVRGSAGLRGTYLDLVGHFLQNQAWYAATGYVLVIATAAAPWAIGLALVGVAFSSPFGIQARLHVLGTRPSAAETTHGRLSPEPLTQGASLASLIYWLYRRIAFLWNYPASMNLFCIALLADAVRMTASEGARPLILPLFAACFTGTLAAKQVANALRILATESWKAT